jgi:2-methylcitrate dehydratase PrpD
MGDLNTEAAVAASGCYQELAEWAAGVTTGDLAPEVMNQAALVTADTLGCVIGAQDQPSVRVTSSVIRSLAGTGGRATLLPDGAAADTVSAAYLHAFAADALDFEDSLLSHPSVAAVPAALAVAEQVGASGSDLLRGVVVGYEVGLRIARALCPAPDADGALNPARWAWQGFVAATSAGSLLGLTGGQMLHALGYVGVTSPVPVHMYKHGRPLGWTKTSYAEQTRVGVMGALLAQEGFRCSPAVLDSPDGFWRAVGSNRHDPAGLLDSLGTDWAIMAATLKAYPACRMTHSGYEAALSLSATPGLNLANITGITVHTFSEAANWLAEPRPADPVDATFSLPHLVALGLSGSTDYTDWYSPQRLADPVLTRLRTRTRLLADTELDRLLRQDAIYGARVVVDLGGRSLTAACVNPRVLRGPDEARAKFLAQTRSAYPAATAERLWDTCLRAASLGSVRDVVGAFTDGYQNGADSR